MSVSNKNGFRYIALTALLASLLTASCMKGDLPEPCRTGTSCESEYSNRPSCDTVVSKHPETRPGTED